MAAARVGDWQCPNPDCINNIEFPTHYVFGSKVNCPKCGTGKSAQRPGDWCCPNAQCLNHQNTVYGSKSQCQRCGAARPPLNARGGAVPNESPTLVGGGELQSGVGRGGVPMPRVGDWHCPNSDCKNHTNNLVFSSKMNCPICGTEKPPAPSGPQPMAIQQPFGGGVGGGAPGVRGRPGDWHCSNPDCKNHTENVVFGSKTECPICFMPKPDDPKEWTGPIVPSSAPPPPSFGKGGKGKGKGFAGGCFGGGVGGGFGGGFGGPGGGGGCFGPGKGKGGGKGSKGQPGDWHCPNPSCKNHTDNIVFASKMSCPICATPKPMAEISVSTSCRPGDWQCPNVSCKNHVNGVYASKSMCAICGSPNPNMERERSRSPRLG